MHLNAKFQSNANNDILTEIYLFSHENPFNTA